MFILTEMGTIYKGCEYGGNFKTWTVDRRLDHGLDDAPKSVGLYDARMYALLAAYGLVYM